MRTKVTKIGNSIGLIIPKKIAQPMGIEVGSEFELTLEDGKLIASPCDETTEEMLLKSVMYHARILVKRDPEIKTPEELLARVETLVAKSLEEACLEEDSLSTVHDK